MFLLPLTAKEFKDTDINGIEKIISQTFYSGVKNSETPVLLFTLDENNNLIIEKEKTVLTPKQAITCEANEGKCKVTVEVSGRFHY